MTAFSAQISRRSLLVGAAAGGGLILAWGLWPRHYTPNLDTRADEQLFGAYLKIDRAGQIIAVVPQAELGQGSFTILPQILADELGADWRTVAVQPAPIGPLYANSLLFEEWRAGDAAQLAGRAGDYVLREYAVRNAIMLTAGSTSARMFGPLFQQAGAAARVLLCKAAAARWDVPWESCDIVDGLVTDGDKRRYKIGELIEEAVRFDLPDILPLRQNSEGRLAGQDLPRLDTPAKVDGSANYAADVRLPDMVFASIRQGPVGNARLKSIKEAEARKVQGFVKIVQTDRWVAVCGTNWWAANKALDALDPVFDVEGVLIHSGRIEAALEKAFDGSAARRLYSRGDLKSVFDGAGIHASEFQVAPALHLALEPMVATARVTDEGAEVWIPSQAPTFARNAVAQALGMPESAVTLYSMMAGGSFDRKLDHEAGVQAALIARDVKRPVQLMWSRAEDIIQDRPRPPAHARMAARLGRGGVIRGWSLKVAAPSALAETWARIADGEEPLQASSGAAKKADRRAVSGGVPPYAIENLVVDHYPADIGLPTGGWRGNADSYTAFFTESFIDELASIAGIEPMSFRIQMLGGQPRLARCLTTAAALGGWNGGVAGGGQGIACHMMSGSYIAVMVEAGLSGGKLAVKRIVAAADCGDQVNPDIARQQIEGGLIFGLASAMGTAGGYQNALPTTMRMGETGLPRLAEVPDLTVELIASNAPVGGIGEIGVPAIAPAIANALHSLTGQRLRSLPLLGDI